MNNPERKVNAKLIVLLMIIQTYYIKYEEYKLAKYYRDDIQKLKGMTFSLTNISQAKELGISRVVFDDVKEYLDTGRIMSAEDKKKEMVSR